MAIRMEDPAVVRQCFARVVENMAAGWSLARVTKVRSVTWSVRRVNAVSPNVCGNVCLV